MNAYVGSPAIPLRALSDIRCLIPDALLHGELNIVPLWVYGIKLFADQANLDLTARGLVPTNLEYMLKKADKEDDQARRTKGPDCEAFLRIAPRLVDAIADVNSALATMLYIGIGSFVRAAHALSKDRCGNYEEVSVKQFAYWSHNCIRALIRVVPNEYTGASIE